MKADTPVDYQAALDAFRKEELTPDNPIRSADPSFPSTNDGHVDYLAAAKAWDEKQEGLHKIHLQAGKRNPSHDPIYRGEE